MYISSPNDKVAKRLLSILIILVCHPKVKIT